MSLCSLDFDVDILSPFSDAMVGVSGLAGDSAAKVELCLFEMGVGIQETAEARLDIALTTFGLLLTVSEAVRRAPTVGTMDLGFSD